MNSVLTFEPIESPTSSGGTTTLRLNAHSDAIIVGQAICKYIKNPQNRFDQTATLSILSSIYGAMKGRFEKVFEEGTAMRQVDIYPKDAQEKLAKQEKISGIGIGIIREVVKALKSQNIAFIEIEVAKGGGDNLASYYQSVGEKLISEGVIIEWSYYRDGIRFQISDSIIPFV